MATSRSIHRKKTTNIYISLECNLLCCQSMCSMLVFFSSLFSRLNSNLYAESLARDTYVWRMTEIFRIVVAAGNCAPSTLRNTHAHICMHIWNIISNWWWIESEFSMHNQIRIESEPEFCVSSERKWTSTETCDKKQTPNTNGFDGKSAWCTKQESINRSQQSTENCQCMFLFFRVDPRRSLVAGTLTLCV